ncbi:unnamed protein product [Mycena citricolor]|uniref:DUF302 domain-containing protein n=1 Tax=Mycena citricolor TaxID=2018698 RepID=A0AAD2K1D3_9AGAR|nr:unnamed protein product [Mycena citricolor]
MIEDQWRLSIPARHHRVRFYSREKGTKSQNKRGSTFWQRETSRSSPPRYTPSIGLWFMSIPRKLLTLCLLACAAVTGATTIPAAPRSHNPVQRSVTPHMMEIVQVTTPVSYDDVSARLYSMVGFLDGDTYLIESPTLAVLKERVASSVGSSGLIHFAEHDHGAWFQLFFQNPTSRFKLFVIGNPVVAETMVKYDFRASYFVPVRILLLENGNGTKIFYQQPSSVMNLIGSEDLKNATEALDRKVESFIDSITTIL